MDKQFFHLTQIRELPTGEFITCYDNVISILDDVPHSIDSPEFKAVSAKVVNNYVELDKLDRKIMGTALTGKISTLHKERVELVRHIKAIIASYPAESRPDDIDHLKVLEVWFRKHSSILPGGRQGGVTRSLIELNKVMTNNLEFVEAVEAIGLSEAMNNLVETNSEYVKIYKQRSVLWGGENTPNIDANKIKRESLKDLKMLINNISINASLNPESCYSLVRALKAESNRVRTIVLRAQTLRRQAKLEDEGASTDTATAIHLATDMEEIEAIPAAMPAEVDINKPAEEKTKTVQIDSPKSEEEKNTHEDSTNQNEEIKKIS